MFASSGKKQKLVDKKKQKQPETAQVGRIPCPTLSSPPLSLWKHRQSFPQLRYLHVRPVLSSSPTFQSLPCIVSMINKGKKGMKIAELARNPAFSCGVKFARRKTGSKATILNQVTRTLFCRDDQGRFSNFKMCWESFC